MTPRIPDDPDEIRRVADALLASAIPDDITKTDSVLDVVELIARGVFEHALEHADDPDIMRAEVRLAFVEMLELGNAPPDDEDGRERQLGAVSMSEFAVVRTDAVEALRRITPTKAGEYIAALRIVGDDDNRPWGAVVVLGGACPPQAGEQAGEPFVILAQAVCDRETGDIKTGAMPHGEALERDDLPQDLRRTVEALLEVGKRAPR